MIQTALVSGLLISSLSLAPSEFPTTSSANLKSEAAYTQTQLSSRVMSLDNRFGYDLPENAYKDNILLNLAYMSGTVKSKKDINWTELKKPFSMQFSLNPGERFAYHETQLAEYANNIVLTSHSNFGAGDGYKYSDGLYGMGVCHLASLMHWAALDAGLESIAPTNHDFFPIPEVPKQYGVAIYFHPDSHLTSAKQNLYIKNTLDSKVTFKFDFDGDNLKISVIK